MEDETKKGASTRARAATRREEGPEEVETVEAVEGGETVVVNKKDLEAFLSRLESVEAENKKLMAVADKGRLFSEEERLAKQTGSQLIHTVKLTRIGAGGPLVVAWKLVDNESYIENGRMIERQNIEVFFEDGKNTTMRLIDFYRQQNKDTRAEIVRRSRNEITGQVELDVRMKDGKTLTIPQTFVN